MKPVRAPRPDGTVATISIVGGYHPYLWIGAENGQCFATVSDRHSMRRLAEGILTALKEVGSVPAERVEICPTACWKFGHRKRYHAALKGVR